MATNSIVRLVLDSSQYSQALGKARKEADLMADGVKSAAGVLTKLAGAFGVAMGASEVFNRVIGGSNALTDEWDKVMRSVNTTVNEFFSTIATGDFTAFNMGLDALIDKARAASGALDQLWNTTTSFSYFNAQAMAAFDEQMAIIKDKESTPEQIAAAKAEAKRIMDEQREYTGELTRRTMETLGALVVEGNSLDASMITRDVLDRVLRLDISASGDAQKAQLAARYEEYKSLYNAAVKRNTTQTQAAVQTMTGGYSPAKYKTDYEAVRKEMAAINAEYLDAIVYNEVLVKKSDDWLKELVGIANTSSNAERQLATMQKTFNRQAGAIGGAGGTKKPAAVIPVKVELVDSKGIATTPARFMDETISNIAKATDFSTPLEKFTPPITESNVATVDNYVDSLNAVANVMGALNAANVEGAAGWLTYAGNLMTASAMAVEAVRSVVAAKTAEAAASGAAEAAKTPLVGWLMVGGAIASVLAAMASIPSFATGGIVGGSNYTDGITARVSSGEMVINEADQKKLFEQIHSGGIGGGGGRAVVTGEQIVLAVNNYGKRTGRGELI